jgi:hypothetical protein
VKAAALVLALVALLPAAQGAPTASSAASPSAAPPLTVLVEHPHDGVDPFGVAAAGGGTGDPFAVRYGPLVADKGRFDFPFFVADGVLPIESLPDPGRPYIATRDAYAQSIATRGREEAPAVLRLESRTTGDQAVVQAEATPRSPLTGEDLHLWFAVAEDSIHYQPPPGLTNGVTEHRFTLRAIADMGVLDLSAPANASHTFAIDPSWSRDHLSVAAWLQQDAPSSRFDAREVVQATHTSLGSAVVQDAKGVLVEEYSATWCEPCLYGDRAVEDLAVSYGIAQPSSGHPSSRYLEWTPRDALPVAASLALGVAVVAATRRRA